MTSRQSETSPQVTQEKQSRVLHRIAGMRAFIRIVVIGVLAVGIAPVSTFAQETPKVGVVMSTPASFSIIWSATSGLALRPEIDVSRSTSGGGSSALSLRPGLSLLIYTARWDQVRSYFTGQYRYQRATSESGGAVPGKSTGVAHSVGAGVGAEFTPHRRFGVFGEVGLSYTRASSKTSTGGSNPAATSMGIRTAVGVILFF
jgi:hypothetical protein